MIGCGDDRRKINLRGIRLRPRLRQIKAGATSLSQHA
jgi:hypothetical protein